MPLRRVYDATRGGVVSSIHDAYLDRASKWSDIQEYMPFLYSEAAKREKPVVLELGCRRACSTLAFLAGVAETGGHVWSCDICDIRAMYGGIGIWAKSPNWTFISGDDMDADIQEQLPGEVDILFIDTSHEYQHTLDECRVFIPRVRKGGVALFHDTMCHGPWSGPDDAIPPVYRALDDYCAETGREWENLPGEYGMGVIRIED